jgi:hypothetical protein
MMPGVGEVSGSIRVAEDFFSCGAAILGTTPPLPVISEEITKENASVLLGGQLTSLLRQFQGVTDRASQFVSARPHEILAVRPQSDRWSAAECFDHLARTTEAFLPPINQAITAGPRLAGNRRLRAGAVASLLIRSLEPPYRLKHKVLAQLAPQHREFPPAWNAFLNSQAHLLRAVRSATGLAIDEVKIQSPVCARLSYNAYGALGILAAHQRRHLWQAEQVLKALETGAA